MPFINKLLTSMYSQFYEPVNYLYLIDFVVADCAKKLILLHGLVTVSIWDFPNDAKSQREAIRLRIEPIYRSMTHRSEIIAVETIAVGVKKKIAGRNKTITRPRFSREERLHGNTELLVLKIMATGVINQAKDVNFYPRLNIL